MALTLELTKPGETAPKLSLNLSKGARFSVELCWDSQDDVDAHALALHDVGGDSKLTEYTDILSTYNCQKTNPGGHLPGNSDGSFETLGGGLHHSGDARTGINTDIDEVITIDGSKLHQDVVEVPIFVTIHPTGATNFAAVKSAGIRLKDDSGKILGEFELSNQFGQFDAVQMGTLMRGTNGWEYIAAGIGFNGDFNSIIRHFC